MNPFDHYMDAIRETARGNGYSMVDHARYWENYKASHFNMMNDGVHPNHFGHRLFAKLLLKELGLDAVDSDVTSMYIPRNIKWVHLESEKGNDV